MHPLISDNQIRLQFYYFFSIDIKNKANNSSIFGKIRSPDNCGFRPSYNISI